MEERMEYQHAERVAQELKEQIAAGKNILRGSSQHNLDFAAWNYFLARNDATGILELGTGDGAMSNWLAEKVEWFETIDHLEPKFDVKNFHRINILEEEERIKNILQTAPMGLVLYCDNGDKPKEVAMYAKYLGPRDYLAVHDYQIEINRSDIPEQFKLIYNCGLTAFFSK